MKTITIVVPCFNEEQSLPRYYEAMKAVMGDLEEDYEFSLLFVNDGSGDNTLNVITALAEADPRVEWMSLSRNFGKEAAMYAGLSNVDSDYAAVMDADLQDPPSLLPEMLSILETSEWDCVATRRVDRAGEPPLRSWFARKFYSLMSRISDADIVDGARDYRLMHREVVDAIVAMGEYNRFSKGIFGWVGFRTYWLPFENVERVAGETKWSFWKLCKYAIGGIVDFSEMPLNIASWFGIAMTGVSLLSILFIVVRWLIFGDPVAGWASTICVIIFIGGVQLLCMGIMGQYVARTYTESKKRPHYVVASTNKRDAKRVG